MFSSAIEWAVGSKWTIVAAVFAVLLAFGWGYASGTGAMAKVHAKELAAAAETARKHQSERDAADYAVAKADFERRLKEAATVKTVTQKVYVERKVLVQNPCKSVVPKEAIRRLNQIGETK